MTGDGLNEVRGSFTSGDNTGTRGNGLRVISGGRSPSDVCDVIFGGMASDSSVRGVEMAQITREEMDAKLERTEARVERTLAELRADNASFRAEVVTELANMPSRSFLVATAIAIVAVLLASVGIGVTMLGNGIMVATASVDRANQALSVAEKNAQQIQALTENLNKVLQQQAQPGSQDQ